MAKRVWKSIIRRKNKPIGNVVFGALAVTHEEDCPVVFRAKEDTPNSRASRAANNKRFTINLGVEDLPSVPRPESMAKFYTDDEVGLVKRRRSSLALSSTSGDEEDANPFLMREHMRNEEAQRLGLKPRPETCYLDKEIKLRERRKSLFMAQEFPISMGGAGKQRRRSKRDGICLQEDLYCEELKENIPAAEDTHTPSSDKVFFSDDADGSPATSLEDGRVFSSSMRLDIALSVATQMLAATGAGDGASPGDIICFTNDLPPVPPPRPKRDARKKARERGDSPTSPPHHPLAECPSFSSSFQGSSDTPGTPDTPESSSSSRYFLLSEGMDSPTIKSRTLDYRTKRRSQEVEGAMRVYKQRSSDDLSRARNRVLVRSVSEFVEPTAKPSGAGNRRTNSDKLKTRKGEKDSPSFRDRLFRSSRKDSSEEGMKMSRSLPTRTFERFRSVKMKNGGSRNRKRSSGCASDSEEGMLILILSESHRRLRGNR
ncbi:uncharacterized protein LOC122261750 isoform X2 [Penaeus japonicus]|uniref:uncharacterized protein LOC122261750 isoform X2 n=1 Tax=Penaeus japonicus TaxID=27405 RepID=UPI001C70C32E|nr:uncharacterized protein LOC122261750 isoform X2 [Penaeus japonicus]